MPDDSPRLFALNITDHPDGGSRIGIVAKRTYRVHDRRCSVADEQVALVEEPRATPNGAMLLHDMDILLGRSVADVIVEGKARPPRGEERRFLVRVRVGALDRRVCVFGDRRCERDRVGRIRFSESKPIDEVDVGWSSAYGGVDRAALSAHGDPLEQHCRDQKRTYDPAFGIYAYPRNRVGKGYVIEATDAALSTCALPNLEDPSHLLTPETLVLGRPDAWPAGPPVAALGWLSYNYFPRAAMVGLLPMYDFRRFKPEHFFEVTWGALQPRTIAEVMPLQDRMDWAVAQQSALGMRVDDVAPDAPIELNQLHPSLASWSFALPNEVPKMIVQMPGGSPLQLQPRIRTVLLEPERDRVCVVWEGQHREAVPVGPGKAEKIRFAVQWTG